MKKVVRYFVALSILLIGCSTKIYHWEFPYSEEHVTDIWLIYSEHGLESEDIYNILDHETIRRLELSLCQAAYDDIRALPMKKIGPSLPSPYGYCVVFFYKNGDYCIISQRGSCVVSFNEKYQRNTIKGSYLYFNEDNYNGLIEKYLKTLKATS